MDDQRQNIEKRIRETAEERHSALIEAGDMCYGMTVNREVGNEAGYAACGHWKNDAQQRADVLTGTLSELYTSYLRLGGTQDGFEELFDENELDRKELLRALKHHRLRAFRSEFLQDLSLAAAALIRRSIERDETPDRISKDCLKPPLFYGWLQSTLSRTERVILILYCLEGFTLNEAGRAQNLEEAQVKEIYFQSLEKLAGLGEQREQRR